MYDELVERLRASVDGRYEKCDGCPYEEDYPCCVDCLDKMHKQAAEGGNRMKVLVACEESQEVCKAFRALGHEAYSCDIQECSGGHPEWHIKGDCLPLLNGECVFSTMDGKTHKQEKEWDLIIAHPPCTYMSKAGACRMYKRLDGKQYINAERYWKMMDARDFFFKILDSRCHRIAIENPRPLRICGLPQHQQIIQPYQFGHPYSKETLLWLIHLPKLKPTELLDCHTPWMPSNTGGYSRGKGGSRGVAHDQKTASKTFPGIAKAMAEQWGSIVPPKEE